MYRCAYIYINHIQCLLLTVIDWCMIYWWVYKHLTFTLNPSSNTCRTYKTISLSQPVVVCRKWSCMLPMPKNWVQHKNAWPSLIGFGGCHLSSASHVEELVGLVGSFLKAMAGLDDRGLHLPYWHFGKETPHRILEPYYLKFVGLFSFCQNFWGRNRWFGAFLKTFPGPCGKPLIADRRNCLQLKHQVADLERETVRAREERKEELTSVRKRMERHGGHWFIKGWM